MLFRFSLYGFLKNLRFFEPFLILFFRQKGLSFFEIGWLISFREICINVLEVPTGVVADLYGRRKAMIMSFLAYIGSFALFAVSDSLGLLLGAMVCFAIGEAFRTGTHKAMIFDYLQREGRADEKTLFYGTTRSWSKVGTAVSVVIASALVYVSAESREGVANYAIIFWASIVPYCMGLWNFVCYPKYLDACPLDKPTIGTAVQHLVSTCRDCVGNVRLRSLLLESVACEGLFHTSKDYVQPLVKQWVILLPLAAAMSGDQRTAILMGCVTFVLAVVSGIGSKQAHRFATACRGEERAALVGWVAMLALYGLLVPTLHWRDLYPIAIAGFVLLHLVENLWRPVQLSRYDAFAGGAKGATVLSVESQGKSLAMFLLAPLVGFLVDHHGLGMVGVVGVAVVGLRLLVRVVRGTR